MPLQKSSVADEINRVRPIYRVHFRL